MRDSAQYWACPPRSARAMVWTSADMCKHSVQKHEIYVITDTNIYSSVIKAVNVIHGYRPASHLDWRLDQTWRVSGRWWLIAVGVTCWWAVNSARGGRHGYWTYLPWDKSQRQTPHQTRAQSVSPVNNQSQSTGKNRQTHPRAAISFTWALDIIRTILISTAYFCRYVYMFYCIRVTCVSIWPNKEHSLNMYM